MWPTTNKQTKERTMQKNHSIQSWQDLSHSEREQIADDFSDDFIVRVFRFKYKGAYQTRHGVEAICATYKPGWKPSMAQAKYISQLRQEIATLQKQLEHERSEREAAQRTIARLGGGE